MPQTPRLVDLHTDWLLQYAPETTVFEPALYPRVPARLGQANGYLQGTALAVLSSYRNADDWARQGDPWSALGALLTRVEAEFSGRLLIGPADVARFRDDPEGLCWGVIGVEGFDALIRGAADLARLPGLFERGVRLFQPTYNATSVLAGSSVPGDDRGLTDLGRVFLETIAGLSAPAGGPAPLFDLAHLNPRAASEALDWFEADAARLARLLPVYSHGTPAHDGFATPRALTLENLRRLRGLGGVVGFSVGPPFFTSAEQIRAGIEATAAIPFLGREGYEGIAVGTDFLGVDATLPGLGNVAEVIAWFVGTFGEAIAPVLLRDNALAPLARAAGAPTGP